MDQLRAFARHEFRLSSSRKGGGTLRSHLQAIQRQTGRAPAGLLGPERPPGCALVWRTFLDLHAARGSDMGTPLPIALRDVEAWCVLNRQGLERPELDLLSMLDTEFRNARAEGAGGPASGDADDDWSKD